MTVLTLFDSDRARDADLSDAVRGACRACAALHDRRCSKARSAFGAVRRRLTAFTVLRCEEAPFTLFAMNRARLADSRDGLRGACAAPHAPRSPRGAQRR